MKVKCKALLLIDGIVNLLLGIVLLLFPFGMAQLLDVPLPSINFYPTILGEVILGIGIALLIEVFGASRDIRGLGLAGAIAINFCGAGILILWLIFAFLNLPLRGYYVLWTIAIGVLAIGFIELISNAWKHQKAF